MEKKPVNLAYSANRCRTYKGLTTYVGRVAVYDGGRYMYSHSTGVHRLTKEDAVEDAKNLVR